MDKTVPNLYTYYAKNNSALVDYLALLNRRSTLSKKERAIVNLVVRQYNACKYCQSAYTVIVGLNGFTNLQVLETREGHPSFDSKFNALA